MILWLFCDILVSFLKNFIAIFVGWAFFVEYYQNMRYFLNVWRAFANCLSFFIEKHSKSRFLSDDKIFKVIFICICKIICNLWFFTLMSSVVKCITFLLNYIISFQKQPYSNQNFHILNFFDVFCSHCIILENPFKFYWFLLKKLLVLKIYYVILSIQMKNK